MDKTDFWQNFESCSGEKFPPCVIYLLKDCGYNDSEIIRYFAMYFHMVCGKMCYETLSSNLPLPQSSTVRK